MSSRKLKILSSRIPSKQPERVELIFSRPLSTLEMLGLVKAIEASIEPNVTVDSGNESK